MSDSTIVVAGSFREGYESNFDEYLKRLETCIEKHHGEIICRQVAERHISGSHTPRLIMVIDFYNHHIAENIFFEPEYLALIPLRDKIFVDFRMYLTS
jgi:uncharacterized protein (DUF1330 family)